MEKKTRKKSNMVKGFNFMYVIIFLVIVFLIIGAIVLLNMNTVKEIEIPNFVGMTITEAEQKAKEIGVKLEIERNNGTIITSQEPRFMEGYEIKIKKGGTIKVVIDE